MTRFILRRLVQTIPVLWGASLIVFLLIRLIPGDAATVMLGSDATPDAVAALRDQLGLNEPLPVQYFHWLVKVLHADLGVSIQTREPVFTTLVGKFENTLILTLAAMLIATAVGITAGVISATHRYSIFDRVAMLIALFGNSMPAFWLGLILVLTFGLGLAWFPTGGMQSIRGDGGPFELLRHLVLPAITLASVTTALVARMVRSSMLEVIGQDYISTARAKGLTERTTIWRHAFRNALLPVVTVIGLQFGYLLGGAVLTETVFVWPGVGLATFTAIGTRDVPLIQGAILMTSTSFVLINLLVDIAYAYLDPRIKYS
jgi:peptide/nickel transport system permease protein